MTTDWIDLDDIPNDLDWTSRRALVLARDAYRCQQCKEPASHVDHKWPKSIGGTDDLDNLQALCGPCNKAKGSKLYLDHLTEAQASATHTHYAHRAYWSILSAAKYLRTLDLIDPPDVDGIEAYQTASPRGRRNEAVAVLDKLSRWIDAAYPEPELESDPEPLADLEVGQIVHVTGYGKREFRVRSSLGGLVEAVDLHTGGLRSLRREDVAS